MNGKILTGLDFDGTCADTVQRLLDYSARVIQQYFGGSLNDAKHAYLDTYGEAFPLQLQELYGGDASEQLIAECEENYDKGKWKAVYEGAKMFPGVKETLAELSDLGVVGIATGNRADLTRKMVDQNGISDYISFIQGKAEGKKADIMIQAASEYKPRQPMFFGGDAKSDVGLSLNEKINEHGLSIVTIGITGGVDSAEDLVNAGASYVLRPEGIMELPGLIKEIAGQGAGAPQTACALV